MKQDNDVQFSLNKPDDALANKDNNGSKGVFSSYLRFCDKQNNFRMFWFIFPALILPCFFMPLAIYFIFSCGGGTGADFLFFVFVSMMSFISGMVATVGEQSARVTISIFLFAVCWNVLYPILMLFVF
jgi:hypothetical protein